ncbi:MAG: protein kinase domain-containing protein [Planctomycetaceae bacterium]
MNILSDGSDFHERIDAVCVQFARELRTASNASTTVSIELLLAQHSDLPRHELLRELLREELEFLQQRGQHPSADDLQQRFPQDSDVIAEVLSSARAGVGVANDDRTLAADLPQLEDSGPPANPSGSREDWKPQIAGFQIFESLGKGGMGVVYRAIDHHRRQVALKVLPHDRLTDRRAQERFNNEIYALGRLRHPNIVQVHESGHRNGEYFYSMDYIRGQNLAALIRAATDQIGVRKAGASAVTPPLAGLSTQQPNQSGSSPKAETASGSSPHLPEGAIVYPSSDFLQSFIGRRPSSENRRATAAVVQIGIDVAEALHYAHESGVTHRDLKPANLLLDVTGRVWVADFGLAQVDDGAALTMEGEVLGTWRYMSPEQLMGGRVIVDSLTDIYSLGVTLYELLSLSPARDGKDRGEVRNQVAFGDPVPLRQRNPAVPRDLETIIHRAIAYRPKDRYQTMQELAADLRRFQRREPIQAKPAGPLKRFSLWVEREQKLAASLAATAALLLVILGLLLAFVNNLRLHSDELAANETAEKKKINELLKDSEASRLVTASLLISSRKQDPSLALLLAAAGSRIRPTADAAEASILALRNTHEIRSWHPRDSRNLESAIAIHPSTNSVVTTVSTAAIRTGENFPAYESDTNTGKLLRTYGGEGVVFKAVWDRSGAYLATMEAVNTSNKSDPSSAACRISVSVWDKANGLLQFNRTLADNVALDLLTNAAKWPLTFAALIPSGTSLVAGGQNALSKWSVPDGQEMKFLSNLSPSTPFTNSTARFVSTPDNPGTRLAYTATDGGITVIDPNLGAIVWQTKTTASSPTSHSGLELLQNGSLLAQSGDLLSMYAANGTLTATFPCEKFCVSPDGSHALISRGESPFCVIGTDGTRLTHPHNRPNVQTLAIPPNAQFCFTSLWGSEHQFHHLNPADPRTSTTNRIYAPDPPTTACQFLDNTRLLVLNANGTLSLLSVHPLSESQTLTHQLHDAKRGAFTISSDSKLIAFRNARSPKTLLVRFDGNQNQLLSGRLLSEHPEPDAAPFTSDGRTIKFYHISHASADNNNTLILPSEATTLLLTTSPHNIIYKTPTNQIIHYDASTPSANVIVAESDSLTMAVPHPGTQTLALATNHGKSLALYRQASITKLAVPHESQLQQLAFSPSGADLIALCHNSRILTWHISDMRPAIEPAQDQVLPFVCSDLSLAANGEQFVAWTKQSDTTMAIRGSLKSATTTSVQIPGSLAGAVWHSESELLLGTSNGLLRWRQDSAPTTTQITNSVLAVFSTPEGLANVEIAPEHEPAKATHPAPPLTSDQPTLTIVTRDPETLESNFSVEIPGFARGAAMIGDDSTLAVGFEGYETRIMTFEQQRSLLLPELSAGKVLLQTFLPDTHILLTITSSGKVHFYNFDTKTLEQTTLSDETLQDALLSASGDTIVAFTSSNDAIFYSVKNRELFSPISMPEPYRTSNYYAILNSNTISVHADDSKMQLWKRTDSLKQIHIPSPITCMCSLDDSHIIAIKTSDNPKSEAILLDIDTLAQTPLALGLRDKVVSLHLSPEKKHVLFRYSDGICELFSHTDLSLKSLATLSVDFSESWRLEISDEPLMLVSFDQKRLRVFDVQKQSFSLSIPARKDQMNTFLGYSSRPDYQSRLLSPDGNWLILPEQVLECWPRSLLKIVERNLPRGLTAEELRYFNIAR